jgi:hypothetical protein
MHHASMLAAILALVGPCQAWVAPPAHLCKNAAPRPRRARHIKSKNDDEDLPEESLGDAWKAGLENGYAVGKMVLRRFASPKVDDQGLIIADALIAGIVAPGLEILACTALGVPLPAWSTALGARRLVAPTLLRGATLSTCWFGGALSARLYERETYDFPPPAGADDRFVVTFSRTLQAGAFATALLIVSTQLRLTLVFGFGIQLGDSPASDAEIFRQFSDLIRDGATEALVLLSWRLARTELSRLD